MKLAATSDTAGRPCRRHGLRSMGLPPKAKNYEHRLMDYNNDPTTTFADIQKVFGLLEERITKRLTPAGTIPPSIVQFHLHRPNFQSGVLPRHGNRQGKRCRTLLSFASHPFQVTNHHSSPTASRIQLSGV